MKLTKIITITADDLVRLLEEAARQGQQDDSWGNERRPLQAALDALMVAGLANGYSSSGEKYEVFWMD